MIPISGAIEAFLAVFNTLPFSISSFITLSIALFLIVGLIGVILRL